MADPVHDPKPQPDAGEEPVVGDAFDDPIDEDAVADPPGDESADDDALSEALGDLDPDAEAPIGGPPPGGKRKQNYVLCPYCGHTQPKQLGKPAGGERCDNCGGLFEPLSRKATQIAMGPWFLRDARNPFRPGCSFDVIEKLIKAGQIGPTSVMRGPTTRQFWSIARNVPGVAHRLGYCHSCGGRFDPEENPDKCPLCDAVFKTPKHRNELGLAYPNRKAAESAQRSLDRQLALLSGKDMADLENNGKTIEHHKPASPPKKPKAQEPEPPIEPAKPSDPTDLLGDVLGIDAPPAKRPEDVSALDFAPESQAAPPPEPLTSSYPVPPAYDDEPRAAAPIAAPHPNQLNPVQPAKPWIIYLLVALNVIVGLGILAYFLLTLSRPAS
ncbi:MAG: hypothetical protein AAGF84_12275 [Planctomycetota bacterium]